MRIRIVGKNLWLGRKHTLHFTLKSWDKFIKHKDGFLYKHLEKSGTNELEKQHPFCSPFLCWTPAFERQKKRNQTSHILTPFSSQTFTSLGLLSYYKMISVSKHAWITRQVQTGVVPEHGANEQKINNDAIWKENSAKHRGLCFCMKQLNRWALKRRVHKNEMEKWQKHWTCCGRGKKKKRRNVNTGRPVFF